MRIAVLGIESSHVDQFVTLINASSEHELVGLGIVTHAPLALDQIESIEKRLDELTHSAVGSRAVPTFFGDPGQLAEVFATGNGNDVTTSPQTMASRDLPSGLPHGSADAVIIADRLSSNHVAHAKPFIERGLAVFIDKPFAPSLEDAQYLLTLADLHGASVNSFSALRFAPEVVQLSRMLQDQPSTEHCVVEGSFSQSSPFGADFYLVHCVEIALTLLDGEYESVQKSYQDGILSATITGTVSGQVRTVEIQAYEETLHGYRPHAIALATHTPQPIALPPLYLEPGFALWLDAVETIDAVATSASELVSRAELPSHAQMLATVALTQELLAALPAISSN